MVKKTTYEVPKGLNKDNWKKDHLAGKHEGYDYYFSWCPLCMNKQKHEKKKEEWGEEVLAGEDLGVNVNDGIKSEDGLV